MGDVLYIVVPCYNEEAVLPETQKELGNKLETMITAGAGTQQRSSVRSSGRSYDSKRSV